MKKSAEFERLAFSGIQPTSVPHIGNYFGAIKLWTELQDKPGSRNNSLIVSIVDLHALTLPREPEILKYTSLHADKASQKNF